MKEEKENNGNGKSGNNHDTVVIHIGKEKKTSPNPTTGQDLYTLGGVDCSTLICSRRSTEMEMMN